MIRPADVEATSYRRILLTVVLFYAVWGVCAWGAAGGSSLPGIAAAVVAIGLHLAMSPARADEARIVVVAAAIGLVAELALVNAGLVAYRAVVPGIGGVPAWLVGLWAAFGTLIGSLGFLRTRLLLAAMLGLVGGPASYWAGEGIGALVIGAPRVLALVAIGIVWAVATPLLVRLHGDRKPDAPVHGGG